jgi:hypothetical protein
MSLVAAIGNTVLPIAVVAIPRRAIGVDLYTQARLA